MIMRFEREALLKIIELLRENETLDAETMIDLIEVKKDETTQERQRVRASRNYHEGEKRLLKDIVRTHKNACLVPREVVAETARSLGRTENAITTQLYMAAKELKSRGEL